MVQYEELVQDQVKHLTAIFDRLDLLPQHQQIAKAIVHRPHPVYNTHTQGNPLDKWKTSLSPEEIQIIHEAKREMAHEYETIQQHLSVPQF